MDESSREIAELIREGRKVEAIRLLREKTGVDLKRAKDEIERLSMSLSEETSAISASHSGGIPQEVEKLARQGKKLEAVRLLREEWGIGLKEAKERVEAVTGQKGSGCILFVAIFGFVISMGIVVVVIAIGME